jgi:transcriptional regulator with XRE-family HTH domain
MLTAEQLRAARAALRLEQKELAKRARVSTQTIKRLEAQIGPVQAEPDTIQRIGEALELAGIKFVDGDADSGPGVELVLSRAFAPIDRARHYLAAQSNALEALEELTREHGDSIVLMQIETMKNLICGHARIVFQSLEKQPALPHGRKRRKDG